jgi:hypothetical protein
VNGCRHAVAQGRAAGRCGVVRRVEVATRAAVLIGWVPMVVAVALGGERRLRRVGEAGVVRPDREQLALRVQVNDLSI